MDKRAAMERSHFVLLGDVGDFIFHGDNRFMPSVTEPNLIGVDDFLDASIDQQAKLYGKYPIRMISEGNHGRQILKRFGVNPAQRLARKIGAQFGGFSGYLKVRLWHNARGCTAVYFLFHHGSWGGAVIKGLGGAKRFASAFDGWDVFVYGHNHQCHVHQEPKIYCTDRGDIDRRQTFIVNSGTFLESYEQGLTTYGEVKGYAPVSMAAPLVKVHLDRKRKVSISVEVGD
jgi:hypothetical protein